MPATTPNPNPPPQRGKPNADGWTPPAYLSIDLTNDQKEHLKQWVADYEYSELMAWMDERAKSDHDIKIMVRKKVVTASITGMTFASGHLNICLTNRASTAEKALFGLAYRDIIVTGGDWSDAQKVVDDY